MKTPTNEQIISLLGLNTLPSVNYVDISTHKSGNCHILITSEKDALISSIIHPIVKIFNTCEFGSPTCLDDEYKTKVYNLNADGVPISLHMKKTKEKPSVSPESIEKLTFLNSTTEMVEREA